MAIDPGTRPETGARLARGVALIVAVGAMLGLGFNALQRAAGSDRALAWIGREVELASLEDLQADMPVAPDAEETAPAPAAGSDAAGDRGPDAAPSGAGTPPEGAARRASEPASPGTPPARRDSPVAPPSSPAAGAGARAPSGTVDPAPPPARPDLPSIPDTREPLEVQYATAKKFHDAGAALFVDARSREEYEEGHIPGARHLSADAAVEDPSLAARLETNGRPIITYCSSVDCNMARDLAFALIEGGHRKVLVYTAGVAGWQAEGQPLVPGAAPGGASP